jgi:hypothetical protein
MIGNARDSTRPSPLALLEGDWREESGGGELREESGGRRMQGGDAGRRCREESVERRV